MPNDIIIFVSSTRTDLGQYREVASRVINKVAASTNSSGYRLEEQSMEHAVQTGGHAYALSVSREWVRKADWVIVIVAWHYGTVVSEDGESNIGIVEEEYRAAIAQRGADKKVFIFISGPVKSTYAYKKSADERLDLKEWLEIEPEECKVRINKFRTSIEQQFINYFRDIHHFEERLQHTLENAIYDLPIPVIPGSGLAMLILSCEPTISRYGNSVKCLRLYKQIHDIFHRLRQKVVAPVRDQVVPKWLEEGSIKAAQDKLLENIDKMAGRISGEASVQLSALTDPKANDLCEAAKRALDQLPFWEILPDFEGNLIYPDVASFIDRFDNFSSAVDNAFKLADAVMSLERVEFHQCFSDLRQKINDARDKHTLTDCESMQLNEALVKVGTNAGALEKALIRHSKWQNVHDAFVSVFSFRGLNGYQKKVGQFFQNQETYMDGLVNENTERINAEQGSREPETTTLIEELQVLRRGLNDIKVRKVRDESTFEEIRSKFDLTFYFVDKETLAIVNRSASRVGGFDELLRKLHADRPQDSGSPRHDHK